MAMPETKLSWAFFSVFKEFDIRIIREYWDTNNSNFRITEKNELPEVGSSELPAKRIIMNPNYNTNQSINCTAVEWINLRN